jgi:hypothetical protein
MLRRAANSAQCRAASVVPQEKCSAAGALCGLPGTFAPANFAESKQGSSSFLKKRTKKLLFVCVGVTWDGHKPTRVKVFWFFFLNKNRLLPA